MDAFQSEVGAWAEATFPKSQPGSVIAHLRREVDELAAAIHLGPPDAEEEELADCYLLLLHLAHKRGYWLQDAARRKLDYNRRRTWGQPDAEGVVEHLREGQESKPKQPGVGYRDEHGEQVILFPPHDPDKQDEGLALELAEYQANQGLIAAVRAACAGEACTTDLVLALEDYDAAVAANRAHDSRIWAEEGV